MFFTPEKVPETTTSLSLVTPSTPDQISGDLNSKERVEVREKLKTIEAFFVDAIDKGEMKNSDHSYNHYFTSKHKDFGVHLYGRELSLPAGTIVIGKLHKYPVMNILLKGKLFVASENGKRVVEAPCMYPSEPGVKKVAYVIEDCVWANVLMSKESGEENLETIEAYHIATSYEEMGMIDSIEKLEQLLKET
jgi:hypothetical protein